MISEYLMSNSSTQDLAHEAVEEAGFTAIPLDFPQGPTLVVEHGDDEGSLLTAILSRVDNQVIHLRASGAPASRGTLEN